MDGFETYAQVDLGALEQNLDAIRRQVEFRKLLLPVKANAYGHGLTEQSRSGAVTAPLARFLAERSAVDWFGVATVEEGVRLRSAGVTTPVLKLSQAQNHELTRAIEAGLTLTVVDPVTIWAASAAAETLGKPTAVHLKVDTGMRRTGCPPLLAAKLAQLTEEAPYLQLEGVFTHFAAAEDPAEDDFTARQIAQFDDALAGIEDALGRGIELKHAANSAAVERHPAAWYDMVRPGILAYGYPQSGEVPVHVDPVLSLISHVSFVKTVRAGETVSAGRTWVAPRDTRVATIPVGYGDGYAWRLSNRAAVEIGGRRYPQVGAITMDHCLVDLGPESVVDIGEQVTLIGRDGSESIGADDLGQLAGTVSYEILCGIADRVPRVYIG
ncbi:MAG: alanine racemase [Propionibacteriaceae bacterium]|jgi:alanine racemase|nr:alanine racemase [Propionibacteriaceae bacterium]